MCIRCGEFRVDKILTNQAPLLQHLDYAVLYLMYTKRHLKDKLLRTTALSTLSRIGIHIHSVVSPIKYAREGSYVIERKAKSHTAAVFA